MAKSQDLSKLRWDDVPLFLAALREGSLGAAAGRVGLDVSTMSRRLTGFEAALGAQLFERGRDGLTPTFAAEQLLPAAEAMEAAHGQLARDVTGLERRPEGTVRLTAPPGIADAFVAPALVRLHAEYPGIRLELETSVRPLDLTRREADLALRTVQPQGADLRVTTLLSAPWVVAAAPKLARRRLADWTDLPWIAWDRDLVAYPPAEWLRTHAPKAQVVLQTSHFASQISAAEAGLGLLLVPEPYLQVTRLRPVAPPVGREASVDALPTDRLWLVGHRALKDVPRVAAVWAFLKALFRP